MLNLLNNLIIFPGTYWKLMLILDRERKNGIEILNTNEIMYTRANYHNVEKGLHHSCRFLGTES